MTQSERAARYSWISPDRFYDKSKFFMECAYNGYLGWLDMCSEKQQISITHRSLNELDAEADDLIRIGFKPISGVHVSHYRNIGVLNTQYTQSFMKELQ